MKTQMTDCQMAFLSLVENGLSLHAETLAHPNVIRGLLRRGWIAKDPQTGEPEITDAGRRALTDR